MKSKIDISKQEWGRNIEILDCEVISNKNCIVKSYPQLSNINYLDEVSYENILGSELNFKNIVHKSGWKLYRIIFLDKNIELKKMLNILKSFSDLGGKIEKPYFLVASISFSPEINIYNIEDLVHKISSIEKIDYERIV